MVRVNSCFQNQKLTASSVVLVRVVVIYGTVLQRMYAQQIFVFKRIHSWFADQCLVSWITLKRTELVSILAYLTESSMCM